MTTERRTPDLCAVKERQQKTWVSLDRVTADFSEVDAYCMMRTHTVPPKGLLKQSYMHGLRGSMSTQPAVRGYGIAR